MNRDIVGKRVLYREVYPFYTSSNIKEGVVQEISQSGKYVKINDKWYEEYKIRIVEILDDGEVKDEN